MNNHISTVYNWNNYRNVDRGIAHVGGYLSSGWDPRSRIQHPDPGSRILDPVFQVLDPGSIIIDPTSPASRMQEIDDFSPGVNWFSVVLHEYTICDESAKFYKTLSLRSHLIKSRGVFCSEISEAPQRGMLMRQYWAHQTQKHITNVHTHINMHLNQHQIT